MLATVQLPIRQNAEIPSPIACALEAAFHEDKDRLALSATRGKKQHHVFERMEATSIVFVISNTGYHTVRTLNVDGPSNVRLRRKQHRRID
jgi:hypothetical protein